MQGDIETAAGRPRAGDHVGNAWPRPEHTNQLLEASPVGVLAFERDSGVVRYANARAKQLLDVPAFTSGQSPARGPWVRPEDREQLRRDVERNGSASAEVRLRRSDGHEFSAMLNWQVLPGREDEIACWVVDVSRTRQTEQALRDGERRFRDLAANAPMGIYLTDTEAVCLYANAQWCEMTGLGPREASGRRWHASIHPDDRKRVRKQLEDFRRRPGPITGDFRFVRPDGRVTWVSGQAVPLHNDAGTVVGFLGCCTDVSRLRHYESQVRLSRQLAESAGQAKSEFLARMSHELRTPLNAILGFGQLLELDRENLNPVQRQGVEHILASGEQLLRLIEGVLDMSGIKAGRVSIESRVVAVPALLEDCIAQLRQGADLLRLRLEAPPPPQVALMGDPVAVRQVLLNLLSNAIRYSLPGGRVRVLAEPRGASTIRVTVEDEGVGIPLQDQARLFEPFERASGNWTPGAGLGLSVSRSLIELMGGRIEFESAPGKGSRFWFELPAAGPPG